jgi:hypothetical protein
MECQVLADGGRGNVTTEGTESTEEEGGRGGDGRWGEVVAAREEEGGNSR